MANSGKAVTQQRQGMMVYFEEVTAFERYTLNDHVHMSGCEGRPVCDGRCVPLWAVDKVLPGTLAD